MSFYVQVEDGVSCETREEAEELCIKLRAQGFRPWVDDIRPIYGPRPTYSLEEHLYRCYRDALAREIYESVSILNTMNDPT